MTPAEPDSMSVLRVILAFVIVFTMLGALGFGLKYIAKRGINLPGKMGATRRLQIIETLAVDIRRRLVIIRCDNKEHLLLLGNEQDIVVATDLIRDNPKT